MKRAHQRNVKVLPLPILVQFQIPLSFDDEMLVRISGSLLVHLFQRRISNTANTRQLPKYSRIQSFRLTVHEVWTHNQINNSLIVYVHAYMCGNALAQRTSILSLIQLIPCESVYVFLLNLNSFIRDMFRHIDKSNFFIEISMVGQFQKLVFFYLQYTICNIDTVNILLLNTAAYV